MKANIIGCGLSGITSAVILKSRGYDVEIFDTRYHIGGNCFDEKINGITKQKCFINCDDELKCCK